MKISSQTDYLSRLMGDERALRCLQAVGFDAADFGLFSYAEGENPLRLPPEEMDAYFLHLKEVCDEIGFYIGQVHSPFPTWVGDGEDENRLEEQRRAIRATARLGCRYVVVHPAMPADCLYGAGHEAAKELNLARYAALIPDLEKWDVLCAIENMFAYDAKRKRYCPTVCSTSAEMIEYIDALNALSPRFVACLDVGHALISGDPPEQMARALGSRLQVLHIQDNDGREDAHTLPGLGLVDWDALMAALRDIGYPGTFSLEADRFPIPYKPAHLRETFAFMAAVADGVANG